MSVDLKEDELLNERSSEEILVRFKQLILPAAVHKRADSPFSIVVAHGLGKNDPSTKNHKNDSWTQILLDIIDNLKFSSISYTARGHGLTMGWQETAESDPLQFTWSHLADDMNSVANYFSLNQFVASGNSMGSATSLFAAIKYPEKVKALIMIRPPTAFEERKSRLKKFRIAVENLLEKNGKDDLFHFVIEGTCLSDLPPLNDVASYNKITCPVLILAVNNDVSHPLSTARFLKDVIPHAELHIVENKTKAKEKWPSVISDFLKIILKNMEKKELIKKRKKKVMGLGVSCVDIINYLTHFPIPDSKMRSNMSLFEGGGKIIRINI